MKTIGKDEHGMPTINGRKVVTFRFIKEGEDYVFETNKNTLATRRYNKKHPEKVKAYLRKTQDDRVARNRDRNKAKKKHGESYMKNKDVHHTNGAQGGKTRIVGKDHVPDRKDGVDNKK